MNLFDIAVNNAHCLYKHNCRAHGVEHVNLFDFRQGLSKMLMKKSRCVRKQRAHGTVDTAESSGVCTVVKVADIGLKRGRCRHCKTGSTCFGCSECKVRLCKTRCFAKFHRDYSDS